MLLDTLEIQDRERESLIRPAAILAGVGVQTCAQFCHRRSSYCSVSAVFVFHCSCTFPSSVYKCGPQLIFVRVGIRRVETTVARRANIMAPRSSPDAKSGLKRAASASALTTRGVRAAKKTKQCANDAVRSLIDKWLDSHPDQWAEIWANISTGFYDADVTGGNGGDDANEKWDASVQTFEQVNLQWLAQMLAKITGVPLPIFDLVDSFDSRALRKLCIVWFGIPLRLPVTDDLRDKVVMYRLMQLRHEELGRRSYEFQKYVKTTGEIDWVAISPWQFKWEESVVTAVWHHLLGEAILGCAGVD